MAYEALRPDAQKKDSGWELLDSGVNRLVAMMGNQAGRRELLGMDSLVYGGKDLAGLPYRCPPCNTLLKKLFITHVDAVLEQGLPVPLPSYKRSPLDTLVSAGLGCAVRFRDVATRRPGDDWPDAARVLGIDRIHNHSWAYFGWHGSSRGFQRSIVAGDDQNVDVVGCGIGNSTNGVIIGRDHEGKDGLDLGSLFPRGPSRKRIGACEEESEALCLQLGWPDGVGLYRGGTAAARLVAWETEGQVSIRECRSEGGCVLQFECGGECLSLHAVPCASYAFRRNICFVSELCEHACSAMSFIQEEGLFCF